MLFLECSHKWETGLYFFLSVAIHIKVIPLLKGLGLDLFLRCYQLIRIGISCWITISHVAFSPSWTMMAEFRSHTF